ncbi:carbon storage regulator CsrA [Sporolactobacillus kofuensis]|uniref:Translational regulator CsrA n=1 Tax=Sporolactobacillus kofuensis TaxID=269672 RepID=A0ABW1WHR8_9BACL|nr:carbon storage regulator CsrA [Sporolactobacillus kofuensis]MCO7176438.1 carbon storage regulator CsrA [Sporolactobacillus kofuensis]
MLILTRKLGEAIRIGDDIEVKIVGIAGDQIKLGISAPRDIDVNRAEIYEAIQKENSQATQADLSEELISELKAMKREKK